MNSHKLTLKETIFMNLNIMIGAGIIVNTVFLTRVTGLFGCISYLLVGIFMLPLISSIARLIQMHPSGGFYAYSKPISPLLAFVTCWSYFFGKLASAGLILFMSATFIKKLFPILLAPINTISLTLIILILFIYLNLFNLKTGSIFQQLFFIAKSIPLLFAIFSGIIFLQSTSIPTPTFDAYSIASILPFILYSFSGFESACAISRNMQNPQKDAPKAIFYSFFLVIVIYVLFQFLISIMLLPNINNFTSSKDAFQEAFPYITTLLNLSPIWQQHITSLINFVIGFSTLGGAYGIVFSNTWNLYTLAENRHTFLPDQILKLNKHNIPTVAVIVQGIICTFFIIITSGNSIPLQQIASLGTIISYTISIIALLWQISTDRVVPILALITCSGLLIAWVISTITYGITPLLLFIFMSILGLMMYFIKKQSF